MVEKREDILAKAIHVSLLPDLKARATGVVSGRECRSFLRQDDKVGDNYSTYLTSTSITFLPSNIPSSLSSRCTGPTPAGVPVKIMSPMLRVKKRET